MIQATWVPWPYLFDSAGIPRHEALAVDNAVLPFGIMQIRTVCDAAVNDRDADSGTIVRQRRGYAGQARHGHPAIVRRSAKSRGGQGVVRRHKLHIRIVRQAGQLVRRDNVSLGSNQVQVAIENTAARQDPAMYRAGGWRAELNDDADCAPREITICQIARQFGPGLAAKSVPRLAQTPAPSKNPASTAYRMSMLAIRPCGITQPVPRWTVAKTFQPIDEVVLGARLVPQVQVVGPEFLEMDSIPNHEKSHLQLSVGRGDARFLVASPGRNAPVKRP